MRIASLSCLTLVLGFAQGSEPREKLQLHPVPVQVNANRLLGMSMDEDGVIWAGSFDKAVHRYDPRTGKVESIPRPSQNTSSAGPRQESVYPGADIRQINDLRSVQQEIQRGCLPWRKAQCLVWHRGH